MLKNTAKDRLRVILAQPRGFCAGVVRAIDIVELALQKYGPPIYVRHEIVHNRHVVEDLIAKGAHFVEELSEVPDGAITIFSAHGVPRIVIDEARRRGLPTLDATCPLVSKVHNQGRHYVAKGRTLILIGHAGHPEVDGTMGQLAPGTISLIETLADATRFAPRDPERLALVTQTTLSVDDTRQIVDCLVRRFPKIAIPHKEDICYATTNRQAAVKSIAPRVDALIVVGAANSSNSQRLVEVARRSGCRRSFLVTCAGDIDWQRLGPVSCVGVTAGASAPEILVQQVVEAFSTRYDAAVETIVSATEGIVFKLPREVSGAPA